MSETLEDAARFFRMGDQDQAARVCLGLIARDPRDFDALHLLGVICTRRGQAADAIGYLLRAERIVPDNPRLLTNIANAFSLSQRYEEAVAAYRAAAALQPMDPGLANNFGLALRGAKRLTEAIDCYRTALRRDPGDGPCRYNLARTLIEAEDLEEADAILRSLREAPPPGTPDERLVEIVNEHAHVVLRLGRPEEALAILRSLPPGIPPGPVNGMNEALTLLTLGRMAEGWAAYEERWRANGKETPAGHAPPDLDAIAGQRVLLTAEQGRGDVIQFLRYAAPLAALGARVEVSVYDDLLPLAREMPCIEQVWRMDDEVGTGLVCPLMSLPLAFERAGRPMPVEVPYLRVPASRVARIRHHLGPAHRRRIGVVWSGSIHSHARSAMPAAALAPLLRRPDLEFHCLQKEIRPDDLAWLAENAGIATHQAMLRDFGDTAAMIEAMDLVVSIDTSVAHLAGALARPVWIMLPFSADWRWLTGRADSPWYPTARLFRQARRGDWDGVVSAVEAAIPT
jgi:thioredoxin-like negative regulator of GroEL